MGNRCVITTRENYKENGVGIYLHWNGGRDSVTAFLTYAKMRGFRAPEQDCYGWARLCQIIGNFFGGSTSIGIDVCDRLDGGSDNGTYIIEGWKIVGRHHSPDYEQRAYSLGDMLVDIDEHQPADEQIGVEAIDKWLEENSAWVEEVTDYY